MVTSDNKSVVAEAITQAEKKTSAKLSVVIAPASDTYQSYFLLYGLVLGSAVSFGLWMKQMADFPLLLAVQLAVTAAVAFVPWAQHHFLCLVPRQVRHHHAAHRAYEEYLIASRSAKPEHPLVLLYISLGERYAHVLTSRMVREKIPDSEWNAVIATLTKHMRSEGLQTACKEAIAHAATLLAAKFPK